MKETKGSQVCPLTWEIFKKSLSSSAIFVVTQTLPKRHCSLFFNLFKEIINLVKQSSPGLGPAMLWAAWKCAEDSAEVLTTLISLGGKPNQVRSYYTR